MQCTQPNCEGVVNAYYWCDVNTETHEVIEDTLTASDLGGGYCSQCGAEYETVDED